MIVYDSDPHTINEIQRMDINKLREENDALIKRQAKCYNLCIDFRAELTAKEEENTALREVLGFYAEEKSWSPVGHYYTANKTTEPVFSDRGRKARAALERVKGE